MESNKKVCLVTGARREESLKALDSGRVHVMVGGCGRIGGIYHEPAWSCAHPEADDTSKGSQHLKKGLYHDRIKAIKSRTRPNLTNLA